MADNVFRAVLTYFWLGQTMQNQMHFSGPSSDPAQMQVLAQSLADNWVAGIKFRQTRDVRYRLITVRLLESQFPPFNLSVSIDGLATVNTANLPFTAVILRIRTAQIGRHGHGRVYIGGLPEAVTEGGFVGSSELGFYNQFIGAMMAAYGPGGSEPFRLGVTRKVSPSANFLDAVSMDVSPTLGVQRRRNMGVGI
jgi:hypothetical protein